MSIEISRLRFGRAFLVQTSVILLMVALAFMGASVAVWVAGDSPLVAFFELIKGAVGTQGNLAATLTRSVPIIITGIAAAVSFKAGYLNIGLEGQMILGALVAAVTANLFKDLSPLVLLPLTILAGCLGGGLWALPSAWWQIQFKVPILITTLLLNYVANLFASYVVTFPLRDLSGMAAVAQTPMIPEGIQLPILVSGTRTHAGVLILLVLPIVVLWFYRRTVLGYMMRMAGLNPLFAEYGGIPMKNMVLLTMFASGAIAGMAGAIYVLGVDYRYIDGVIVTAGYAWSGYIAAQLVNSNPIQIVITGLVLAGLKVGSMGVQRNTQVPLQLADVIQAMIIFIVAIRMKMTEVVDRVAREVLGVKEMSGIIDIALLASTVRLFTPILLAALGGMFTARAGIFNITLEGLMLIGSFFAVAGTFWTGNPYVGLGLAVLGATAMSLVFGFFIIDAKGHAITIGLAVLIFATGATTFAMRPVFGVTGGGYYDPNLRGLPQIALPVIDNIPVIGAIFSQHSILVYASWLLVALTYIFLFYHPLGLRLRAVGEDAIAAGSLGIPVRGMRYLSVVLCGIFCGLAGAELSISLVTQFVQGMTAGRGFIALVAVMFGRANPIRILGASLLFGLAYAASLRLQGIGIPTQLVAMLPYLITIAVLIVVQIQIRSAPRLRVSDVAETVEK